MKHALTGLLLAGATCAFVLATPAVAQVAGNPGDLHTPTPYMNEVRTNSYGYTPDRWSAQAFGRFDRSRRRDERRSEWRRVWS